MGLGLVGISHIWLFVHEISALLMLRPLFENSQGNGLPGNQYAVFAKVVLNSSS